MRPLAQPGSRKHLTPAGEQGTPSRSGANGHTTRGWAAESAAPAGSPGSPRTAGQPGTPPRSETTGNTAPSPLFAAGQPSVPPHNRAAGSAAPFARPGSRERPPFSVEQSGAPSRSGANGRTHPKPGYRECPPRAAQTPAGGCLRLTRGVHQRHSTPPCGWAAESLPPPAEHITSQRGGQERPFAQLSHQHRAPPRARHRPLGACGSLATR